MVWYSHLLQNFPWFIVIYTVKGFGGGLHTPNPARPFAEGDVIWLVGEPKDLDTLP